MLIAKACWVAIRFDLWMVAIEVELRMRERENKQLYWNVSKLLSKGDHSGEVAAKFIATFIAAGCVKMLKIVQVMWRH